jgi:hypothetical protein
MTGSNRVTKWSKSRLLSIVVSFESWSFSNEGQPQVRQWIKYSPPLQVVLGDISVSNNPCPASSSPKQRCEVSLCLYLLTCPAGRRLLQSYPKVSREVASASNVTLGIRFGLMFSKCSAIAKAGLCSVPDLRPWKLQLQSHQSGRPLTRYLELPQIFRVGSWKLSSDTLRELHFNPVPEALRADASMEASELQAQPRRGSLTFHDVSHVGARASAHFVDVQVYDFASPLA